MIRNLENQRIQGAQLCQLSEIAQLRWDCAIELIRVEQPESATFEYRKKAKRLKVKSIKRRSSDLIDVEKRNDAILSVQPIQLSKLTELRRDAPSELILGEVPKRATINEEKDKATQGLRLKSMERESSQR